MGQKVVAAPENGATLLVVCPELDICATIPGYSDTSFKLYVTSAPVGNKFVAVPENGATILVE